MCVPHRSVTVWVAREIESYPNLPGDPETGPREGNISHQPRRQSAFPSVIDEEGGGMDLLHGFLADIIPGRSVPTTVPEP